MGNFKGDGRGQGRPGRRRGNAGRRGVLLDLERLEGRTLMAIGDAPRPFAPVSPDFADVKNGPLASAGQTLVTLYQEFQAYLRAGANGAFVSSQAGLVRLQGTSVGVDVSGSGDFGSFVTQLRDAGMQVETTDGTFRIVEGLLPISQLPTVAALAQTVGLYPIYRPRAQQQQGIADNQGDRVLLADVARTQFGVDGTGVIVGVLSDSISQFQGGLADSVRTGDLPANVNVLLDEPAGGNNSDEGRAMLEQIYDIAPGAGLAFHTAFLGPLSFANGIRLLASQAGAQVIVDDVGYSDEPFFQDGIIAQGVIDVVRGGASYFSSAGNSDDGGYESDFRPVDSTAGSLGSGRYMDFDPGPGILTTLPVTVNGPGSIIFQYDQPFYTSAGVTSDLDIFVLDAAGTVVAMGNSNNIAQQTPLEFFVAPQAGNFSIAIRIGTGPDVGRVRFQGFSADITVSQQFGATGNTTYPTTFGHSVANEAIGVGAVPFFGAPPFANPNPITSEPFSSFGPVTILFDGLGNRLPSPQVRLKPDVSGPDGNNTSFFGQDSQQDTDTLPNFFGTSSAAPNLAAVAALLKQTAPAATANDIRNAFIASAIPLNGAPQGAFDPQGGFGLVQAPAALAAVSQLRVTATNPSNGQTITVFPTAVRVSFSQPVSPGSLQASDLVFTQVPPGVTITVGTPTLIDPQTALFPITITTTPGILANGTYSFTLADNSIVSTDGTPLVGATVTFVAADAIAPRVVNSNIEGRLLVVQFSEPVRPGTIVRQNIQLIRTGPTGVFNNPSNITVTDDSRVIYTYDAVNNRALIDLSLLSQTQLPSDNYRLVVRDDILDLVGNNLDGEFSGLFPSGNGVVRGNFIQPLGFFQVTAPQIISLALDPASDTGVPDDQNTNLTQPLFTGQIRNPFPGAVAGLTVAIQYIQLHPAGFDLAIGLQGRGFVGNPDQIVTTDAQGQFRFAPPVALRDGFHRLRIIVVGESDAPPLPGFSSTLDRSFRVDTSQPLVVASSLAEGSRIQNLAGLSLSVSDPVSPAAANDILAVPTQLSFPALNPATATNISNYSLINLGQDRAAATADDRDFSNFITSANFVGTTLRTQPGDPYTGRIDLTFAPGLPPGRYLLIARTTEAGFSGITDAAGNPLDQQTGLPGSQSFSLTFDLQPQAAFITSFLAISPSPIAGGPATLTGPRAFYELPIPGNQQRATPPPRSFAIDFSNPLAPRDYGLAVGVTGSVRLLRSGNGGGTSDGDFGPGGLDSTLSTLVPVSVILQNSIVGATIGQAGFLNRLLVTIDPNVTLPADTYRFYIPNGAPGFVGTEVFDLFGNQLDGEFLGNPIPSASPQGIQPDGTFRSGPLSYEDFLPDGTYRAGLTGDGVAGGAFTTGFNVVANGNILFARPDYFDDPFLSGDDPDGSLARPFPALAPEAETNFLNRGNLNAQENFGTGFNAAFDRSGNGRFDRSVIFAAQQRSTATGSPVVIVALPGLQIRNPVTNTIEQATFVLQAPSGPDAIRNDGSISVPFNTTLAFAAGATVKLQNASIFAQNQGTAIQTLGGANPNDRVIFTSFADDSIGGDSNRNRNDTQPIGGDWGGLVLRNFDDATPRPDDIFTDTTRPLFPVDGRLRGPGNNRALSGADDILSAVNFATLRYGGGAVPLTLGPRYDSFTLFNSRPAITNVVVSDVSDSLAVTSAQAGISADFDSFREDDIARGPLIRRTSLLNNSINGILVRAEEGTVQSQQTDAIFYNDNPTSQGAARNFVFDDPLPHVLISQLILGQALEQMTGGVTLATSNRLYVQPGMLIKARTGASIFVSDPLASINIGDRTYIREFDANANASPIDFGFQPNTTGDARPIFTTLLDDTATTFFFDPNTGARRTIVPANDTNNDGGGTQPVTGNIMFTSRWGALQIVSGAVGVIDEAEFRFGGGSVITPDTTIPSQSVLSLVGATFTQFFGGQSQGSRTSITNNDFFDNFDAPISIEPNGLLAADPIRPLQSGNPFFRGNVFLRNDINGLAVLSNPTFLTPASGAGAFTTFTPVEAQLPSGAANLTVNSIWDDTDLTYVVRGSIVLDGYYGLSSFFVNPEPLPNPTAFDVEQRPFITLTIESSLPDTLLADGTRIARPGETVLVKLLNDYAPAQVGPGTAVDPDLQNPGADTRQSVNVGAGFAVGVDDGIPPGTGSPLIDPGVGSQIRIVGIGNNETTGQQRVPAIISSLRDASVGKTVRGVDQFDIFQRDNRPGRFTGAQLRTPARDDGGKIYFGGNTLTDYNLYDPRNGNLIDNADLRFLTRIEIQGGGIVDAADINNDGVITFGDSWRQQKLGNSFLTQFNSSVAMTISNSNISDFRDAGVFIHPAYDVLVRTIFQSPLTGALSASFPSRNVLLRGFGVDTFFVNNTFSNLPVGVRINVERTGVLDLGQSPEQAVFLNNTFNNNGVAVHTDGVNPNGASHVHFLAMNNIVTNTAATGAGFRVEGNNFGSQLQFNLFFGNTTDIQGIGSNVVPNFNPRFGDPLFRDAANRNFNLLPGSAAIDASLSEFGPVAIGDILFPISDQRLDATGGVRNIIGRQNPFGGRGFAPDVRDIVTLPGFRNRGFVDQFIPVPAGTPGSSPGPSSVSGSYNYLPIGGERDQLGFLRQDDRLTSNIGFGSRPFFDLGAFEFRELFPPHVTNVGAPDVDGDGIADAVTANIPDPSAPGGTRSINIYRIGGVAGTNQPPLDIQFRFDSRLDTNTITNQTVVLQASGGDGIFNNGNSSLDRSIDLSGKLGFDLETRTLTIALGSSNLSLGNDVYRIILRGSGSNVIRDPEGNALDGENLDAAGLQRPLPSGDSFPGGDFVVSFTIDASAPSIAASSLTLAAASDTNRPLDRITNSALPSFTGTVFDIFPPALPLAGQTVILDISTRGDGVFDRSDAGRTTTDAAGNFTVTVAGPPLPDSAYNVGPDGLLGTADDTGTSLARVRIVDQAGNASDPTDPNTMVRFIVDTRGPRVLDVTPAPDSQATISGGRIALTVTVDENVDPASLVANQTLSIMRAGGDGTFGNADDVVVPIDPASITVQPLFTPGGAQIIRFFTQVLPGTLANDVYRVTIGSAGGASIIDIAGNALDGDGDGQPGGILSFDFLIFDQTLSRTIFVGANVSATPDGTLTNPFPTITAGLAAALTGDIVAVLPGVYTETITLKSLVRLLATGTAQQTIIRAPVPTTGTSTVTVLADGLLSSASVNTEIAGFTIASPLMGNPANGSIRPDSVGISVRNSNILIDRNYIIDSGFGINVETGANSPRIESNGVIGNIIGVHIDDTVSTDPVRAVVRFANNTVAFNTFGLFAVARDGGPLTTDVVNNIFWQNHDRTAARSGAAILATEPGGLLVRFNLFSGNGPSQDSPADDTVNVTRGFDPALIGPVPVDGLGNIVGEPAFVTPRDPRPQFDGPAVFLLDANYNLGASSAAIDNAFSPDSPLLDFNALSRDVDIPGRGFAGRGPSDIGAFEFRGSGVVLNPVVITNPVALPETPTAPPASTATVNQPQETRAQRRRRLREERRQRAFALRQQRAEQRRLRLAQRAAQRQQAAASPPVTNSGLRGLFRRR